MHTAVRRGVSDFATIVCLEIIIFVSANCVTHSNMHLALSSKRSRQHGTRSSAFFSVLLLRSCAREWNVNDAVDLDNTSNISNKCSTNSNNVFRTLSLSAECIPICLYQMRTNAFVSRSICRVYEIYCIVLRVRSVRGIRVNKQLAIYTYLLNIPQCCGC